MFLYFIYLKNVFKSFIKVSQEINKLLYAFKTYELVVFKLLVVLFILWYMPSNHYQTFLVLKIVRILILNVDIYKLDKLVLQNIIKPQLCYSSSQIFIYNQE